MSENNANVQPTIPEATSITLEKYLSDIVPMLNAADDLLNSHPDVPEDVPLEKISSSFIQLDREMRRVLENRVPEIARLQAELDKEKARNAQLKDKNQALFLQVTTQQPVVEHNQSDKPQLKSWDEIDRDLRDLINRT